MPMNSEVIAEPRTAQRVVASVLAAAGARLERAGIASARLDAEVLMAMAAGVSRAALLGGAAAIDAAALSCFERMVTRREARVRRCSRATPTSSCLRPVNESAG